MRSETMTDRELDAAVAERVMGFPKPAPLTYSQAECEDRAKAGGGSYSCWDVRRPGWKASIDWGSVERERMQEDPVEWEPDAEYSTDIAAAWAVVEKMRERGETDPVFIEFVRNLPSEDCVDLMFRLSPRLICLSALAAPLD